MRTVVPEAVGLSSARLARIGAAMRGYVEAKAMPGAITLVARHGQVAYCECVGVMDVKTGVPLREDAIFRIFSMTKPITCVALMMLFEEGKLQLSDPVHKYLPGFEDMRVFVGASENGVETAALERPITIHDLLTHTAGLSYGMQPGPLDDIYRKAFPGPRDPRLTPEAFVKKLVALPLAFQPGAGWRYSFANDVIGCLVSVIAGMSFDRFLQQRIIAPLGMVDTSFVVPAEKVERLTAMYSATTAGRLIEADSAAESEYRDVRRSQSGGGGLVSTTADYLRFARLLMNGGSLDGVRLLSRKTVSLMTRNHVPAALLPYAVNPVKPQFGYGYGLGFGVLMNPAESEELASEGTYHWNGAAATRWWNDPTEGLTGMLMTQVLNADYMPPFGQTFKTLVYQAIDD
jgi:CubicO group peptidase (beta-lactamase class C family)